MKHTTRSRSTITARGQVLPSPYDALKAVKGMTRAGPALMGHTVRAGIDIVRVC